MKIFLFIALSGLVLFGSSLRAEEKPFHICYFSLNNAKEFEETKKFTDKINQYSPRKIIVTEYQDPKAGVDTNHSFKKLVESGAECDGLVISGHHTGSWGGARSSGGSLSISYMEELACDPKHKAWFERIHALWLQGCRTLGVGEIHPDEREVDALNADFHTQRVGDALHEDQLQEGFHDLNMEFSATLDQDNPLSSRYLRLFPRSTVFGWTRTAPGKGAKSEYSLPYHLAHIAKRLSEEDKFPDDPIAEEFSSKTASAYLRAMQVAIGSLDGKRSGCEDLLVNSWLDHGNALTTGGYGFDNPDLNAYKALEHGNNPIFNRAKELDCLFRQAKDKATLMRAVVEALKTRQSIGLSFNSMFEAMQRLKKEGDIELLAELKKKLQNSESLQVFLEQKIMSPQLGILKKIDYYAFYKEMQGKNFGQVEEAICEAAKKQLLIPLRNEQDFDRIDYKQTLMQSLTKHDLVTDDFILDLVKAPDARDDVYSLVADVISSREQTVPNLDEILATIMNSSHVGVMTLGSVGMLIAANPTVARAPVYLKQIFNSPKLTAWSLSAVASAIGSIKPIIPDAAVLLEKIIARSNVNGSALPIVVQDLYYIDFPVEKIEELLGKVIDSPAVQDTVLAQAAWSILNRERPLPHGEALLEQIIRSPEIRDMGLSTIAQGLLGKNRSTIKVGRLLGKILDSPESMDYVPSKVAWAIGASAEPIENAEALLGRIIEMSKWDGVALNQVAAAIRDSKQELTNSGELLEKIIDSPRLTPADLADLIQVIQLSKQSIPNREELIKKIRIKLKNPYPLGPRAEISQRKISIISA